MFTLDAFTRVWKLWVRRSQHKQQHAITMMHAYQWRKSAGVGIDACTFHQLYYRAESLSVEGASGWAGKFSSSQLFPLATPDLRDFFSFIYSRARVWLPRLLQGTGSIILWKNCDSHFPRFFVTVVRMFSVCVSMQAAACPRSFSPEAFTLLFGLDNIWMLHFVQ
jgi:hypothetical protein